jgi:hypothetical protein
VGEGNPRSSASGGHELWDRPELARIRDFARARQCSPLATLGVVLARTAGRVPPFVVLPPLVGSWLSLNLYVALVGPSGAGKDAAIACGADALELGGGFDFREVGLGSGEGLLDQYVAYRPPKGDDRGGVDQHTESVLFVNPEVETLAALRGRSSATLMPELRSAWFGKGLGFAYANRERRLFVGAHRYRLGLILGVQPEHAGVLLDDQAAGTPQRFVWLPATDPNAPDVPPAEAEPLSLDLPRWPPAHAGKVVLDVCDEAVAEVRHDRLRRLRGDAADPLTGHRLACRLKVAALLGILDGRCAVHVKDWWLAGRLLVCSDATRDGAARAIRAAEAEGDDMRARRDDRRDAVREGERDKRIARRLFDILARLPKGEWLTRAELSRTLASRDRDVFEAAVAVLVESGQIETREGEYHGRPKIEYRIYRR